jgi:hypothetical protein
LARLLGLSQQQLSFKEIAEHLQANLALGFAVVKQLLQMVLLLELSGFPTIPKPLARRLLLNAMEAPGVHLLFQAD